MNRFSSLYFSTQSSPFHMRDNTRPTFESRSKLGWRYVWLPLVLLTSLLFLSCDGARNEESDGRLQSIDSMWIYESNDNIWGLGFVGNKVAVMQEGTLRVLASDDGREIWKRHFGDRYRIIDTFDNSVIVTGGFPSEVISVDLRNGNEIWRRTSPGFEIREKVLNGRNMVFWTRWETILLDLVTGNESRFPYLLQDDSFSLAASSVSDDGMFCSVFASVIESRAFCQDISSGAELWHKEYGPEIHNIVEGDTTHLSMLSFGPNALWNDLVVFTIGPYTDAYDRYSGDLLWRMEGGLSEDFRGLSGYTSNTAQVLGDTLYVTHRNTEELFALDPGSGEKYWESVGFVSPEGTIVRSQEVLMYTDGVVVVVDAETGEKLSINYPPFGFALFNSDPIVVGDQMLVDSSNGLHMFKLTR